MTDKRYELWLVFKHSQNKMRVGNPEGYISEEQAIAVCKIFGWNTIPDAYVVLVELAPTKLGEIIADGYRQYTHLL